MKVIAGLDIGNGYIKGSIQNAQNPNDIGNVDMPSCAALLTKTYDLKAQAADIPDIMNDIYNQMDVSFVSPLIESNSRFLFGQRGIHSGNSMLEFDVFGHTSKAKQELSFMLTLGCLAGKAVQDYYFANKAFPTSVIKVDATVALALPIGEYMKYKNEYASEYMSGTHGVEIHNFEQPINVEIAFHDVKVIAEGASAQLAIKAKGNDFMNAMLTDIRRMGEPLDGITAEDVLAAKNTLGVDIGEGTVNFPVFQNGVFNPDSSATFDKGYGAVLNAAVERLQDKGYSIGSRKELQDFLNTQPSALNRNKYKRVQDVTNEEITGFATEVAMQFSKVFSRIQTFNEVVYVYGGGATPVRNELYPMLIEKAKNGGQDIMCPILYLDSRYSRYLNREGLFTYATMSAKKR